MDSKRIDELEIKFTLQEDMIVELNDIVTRQQFIIDKLVKDLKKLSSLVEANSNDMSGGGQEKPPHY